MSKLHIDTLLLLAAAAQYGLDLDTLLADLRQQRHRALTLPELEKAVRDLADRSFASHFTSALGSERWRITGLGTDALKEEGL